MRAERDHLDVGERLGSADQLDADLVELAQPALLRPLVAKHRPGVEALERPALAQGAADHRARDARRVLRPERELRPAAVGEGVHLLGHDVRGIAQRAAKHVAELEDRRRHFGEPVAGGERCARARRRGGGGASRLPRGRAFHEPAEFCALSGFPNGAGAADRRDGGGFSDSFRLSRQAAAAAARA